MQITIKSAYGTTVTVEISKDADIATVIEAIRGALVAVGYSAQLLEEVINAE